MSKGEGGNIFQGNIMPLRPYRSPVGFRLDKGYSPQFNLEIKIILLNVPIWILSMILFALINKIYQFGVQEC